jgi:uncharacterized protein involved in tolerance to divalent cations
LLERISETELFRSKSSEYIVALFKSVESSVYNWKNDVLTNKEIANLAATTEIAMRLCLESRFKEDLAIYLNFLIENEVIYSFDIEGSINLLMKKVP